MSYQIVDFIVAMEKLAPPELAFEWDNVGLQIGDPKNQVKSILVTLTLTPEVAKVAVANKVDLIIAHHPIIFKPLRQIRTDLPQGDLLTFLIKHDISVYVAHTNLDQAPAGLNDWLAEEVGLVEREVLIPAQIGGDAGLGRLGKIPTTTLTDLAQKLELLWNLPVRMIGDVEQNISKVAVVGGSGGDFVWQAKEAGADCLITGDVSYHDALDALSLNLSVLDAGHFATEKIMVAKVSDYLDNYFTGAIQILQDISTNPFSF